MDDHQACFSPDSGVACDMEDDKPPTPNLLDPPQRRLSKSLSADSEWSLDPSLFEAEDLLRDMGFAGAGDPTIPDRFLPSLMQRLSKFPESEMESLHDRIIQSIGCFRRKESKRRLFRNFSTGKDPRRFLGCQNPFLRSNTDPSSFPYDEASNSTSSLSLSSSSNDRTHSLASSTSDLPESPIAILVSEASVDHEQQTSANVVHSKRTAVDIDQKTSDGTLHSQRTAVDIDQKTTDDPFYSQRTAVDVNCNKKLSDSLTDNQGTVGNANHEQQAGSCNELTSYSVDQDKQTCIIAEVDHKILSIAECAQVVIQRYGDTNIEIQADVVDDASQPDFDPKSDSCSLKSKKSVQTGGNISEVDKDAHELCSLDSKPDAALVSQLDDNQSQPDDDISYLDECVSQSGTFGSNHNVCVSQLEDTVSQPVDDVTKLCDDVCSHDEGASQVPIDDDPYLEQNACQVDENRSQSHGDFSTSGFLDAGVSRFEDWGHDNNKSQSGNDVCQFDSSLSQSDFTPTDDDVSSVYLDSLELDYNEFKSSENSAFCNYKKPEDSNSLLIVSEQKLHLSEDNLWNRTKIVGLPNDASQNLLKNAVFNSIRNDDFVNLNTGKYSVTNAIDSFADIKTLKNKSSNSKTPLRRTSNGMFGGVRYQNDMDIDGPVNTVLETFKVKDTFQNKMWNPNVLEPDGDVTGVKFINESAAVNSAGFFQSESLTNKVPLQNMHHDNGNICKLIKPKYSRDNSLTNFLSSMLDTSGGVSRSPIPVRKTFADKNSNSDSEVPGSFATSPFNSFPSLDLKGKFTSNVEKKTNVVDSKPIKSYLKVQELIDKAPNRKRRMLRRVSSSLQNYDDENCDTNDVNVGTCKDDVPMSSYVEPNPAPKQNYGHLTSESSNHRAIYPCHSFPVSSLHRGCDIHCETNDCQTQQTKTFCDCDAKAERNISHSRKCKRKRNRSCPFPEMSFSRGVLSKPKSMPCSCIAYEPILKNDVHEPLTLPCNLSPKESFSNCRCCNGNSNYRMNFTCAESQSNVVHSLNAEKCDSNVRCFGPPSPTLLRPGNFGSNIWNQNRHLCYSSPDLSQDRCPNLFEHCKPRSFANVDKCHFNSHGQYDPHSCLGGDSNLNGEVFLRNSDSCCSLHHKQCLPKLDRQPISKNLNQDLKTKMSIRIPQRQNSISIADSEIPAHNSPLSGIILTNLLLLNKDNFKKDLIPESTIPCVGAPNKNVHQTPSSTEVYSNSKTTQHNKPPLTLKIEEPKEISTKPPNSPTTKSEALLERKIRIFSKFLANLGNLSKTIPDTNTDNKHKRTTRDQKCSDVPNVDKKTKPRALKVSCPVVQPRRKSVPELGKLLHLLKSMDSSTKSGEHAQVPNEKLEVSEQFLEKPSEKEYLSVYKNKVQLQASECTDGERRISYKPVLYSSSVSLYVNAEHKMATQKERSENIPGADKEAEASPKKEQLLRRSFSQMSFRGVSKEIEDLQLSIKKAKETRMCASKELHLLQELLSMDVTGERHRAAKDNIRPGVDYNMCEPDAISKSKDVEHNQALADLRAKSKKEVLEDTTFWKEEIEKVKEETKQAWQAKLDRLEARLASQEDELRRLQGETTTFCKTTENGRTDSAFEDDDERRPTTPLHQCRRVDCERMQRRLAEEEQRADQLNLMLNQKSIELNKLQIQLSKQTKEMIELEKSYLQLQCRLRRGTSKPLVSRLCSRASPFAPKNLKPPSPPPPTNGSTT